MTNYYDAEVARLFDVFATDTDVLYRWWLQKVLPLPGPRTAVDLGCGSGRWTSLLADRYITTGVDISPEQLAIARRRFPDVTFAEKSLLDVEGQFDVVLSVNTIHYLRDHPRVLRHVRSLVAPGGTAVLVDLTDPGGWATRDYQVEDAFRDARESYLTRSGDYKVAANVLELRLHPAWLEHCLNDVPLRRPEFITEYGSVFPGAEFEFLHRVITGMVWTAPAGHSGGR